jgi:hypothetical protein
MANADALQHTKILITEMQGRARAVRDWQGHWATLMISGMAATKRGSCRA